MRLKLFNKVCCYFNSWSTFFLQIKIMHYDGIINSLYHKQGAVHTYACVQLLVWLILMKLTWVSRVGITILLEKVNLNLWSFAFSWSFSSNSFVISQNGFKINNFKDFKSGLFYEIFTVIFIFLQFFAGLVKSIAFCTLHCGCYSKDWNIKYLRCNLD